MSAVTLVDLAQFLQQKILPFSLITVTVGKTVKYNVFYIKIVFFYIVLTICFTFLLSTVLCRCTCAAWAPCRADVLAHTSRVSILAEPFPRQMLGIFCAVLLKNNKFWFQLFVVSSWESGLVIVTLKRKVYTLRVRFDTVWWKILKILLWTKYNRAI